jgi:hypothetical protein
MYKNWLRRKWIYQHTLMIAPYRANVTCKEALVKEMGAVSMKG